MAINLRLRKESMFRSTEMLGPYKGEVVIAKTGDGHSMPHVTAITYIDRESFIELAQAMMDANARAAIKAFGKALVNGPKDNDVKEITDITPSG